MEQVILGLNDVDGQYWLVPVPRINYLTKDPRKEQTIIVGVGNQNIRMIDKDGEKYAGIKQAIMDQYGVKE